MAERDQTGLPSGASTPNVNAADPLLEIASPAMRQGGLEAILHAPEPLSVPGVPAYSDEVILSLFELLDAVICRDSRLKGNFSDELDAESPKWRQAYCKLMAYIICALGNEEVADKFAGINADSSLSEECAKRLRKSGPQVARETGSIIPEAERYEVAILLVGMQLSRGMVARAGKDGMPGPVPELLFVLIRALAERPRYSDNVAVSIANCISTTAMRCSGFAQEREVEHWRDTATSVLRVREFTLLAGRDAVVAKKYGDENIAERFEQQLNLALQHLGFRTMPTVRGSRRGDIVCLTDQSPIEAILVEAKTSARPYRLPVADERALVEYANQDLPYPLRLIVLVGPKPSDSLSVRLRRLERSAGRPVRYFDSSLLASLLNGPPIVSAKDLIRCLLESDLIVSASNLESMIERSKGKTAAWNKLVTAYLDT